MDTDKTAAYDDLVARLTTDPDEGVASTADGLTVRGSLFAFPTTGGDLALDLAPERAADLLARGIAQAVETPATSRGTWVSVADPEDWPELAAEAHRHVGEPVVGGES